MFPGVEVRHLRAVNILAEELNFTRAADRLNVTQSALSKQINEIEKQHRFHLFARTNKKNVELTEVGRVFVQEARSALLHIDRAVQLAQAAREGIDSVLTIGHSPDLDQAWVSAILALPSTPLSKASDSTRQRVLNRVDPKCYGWRTESGICDGAARKS